jgi:hypothetical protein
MAKLSLTLRLRLPWWWGLYFVGAWICHHTIGGIDPHTAAEFLVKHSRFEEVK